MKIDKVDVLGPTAQRFNSQGPGSGKEIKNRGAKNPIGNDVEDCLPSSIRCRANDIFPCRWREQFSAFAFAADNPHLFIVGDKIFSNLDGIEGRTLEDIVGYHPHVDTVGNRFILADSAHQSLEFSFTVNS